MTDKELLELAAKAAGYDWDKNVAKVRAERGLISLWIVNPMKTAWNPLADDGDALRLAVKLRMSVRNTEIRSSVLTEFGGVSEPHKGDPYAATRRAIVRAAAEIGRNME